MNPKTVAFVEGTAGMGGVEFSTLYLAEKLNREFWRPIIITPEEGELTRACGERGIRFKVIERPPLDSTSVQIRDTRIPNLVSLPLNLMAIARGALGLTRFFKTSSVDLIVTKSLLTHIYGGLAARKSSIPCIWHVQDFISERYFGLLTKIFGFFAKRLPDHIIVDGGPIARQLPVDIQNNISIIFNGVDTSLFKPDTDGTGVRDEFGIPPGALVIGNVARITPWKGQEHLIAAFNMIADEISDAYLLLVGSPVFDNDTYERHLKNQVKRAGIENRVIFAGFRYDLPQVLAAMDIFAYSSVEKDTSPLAILSAMASGLPIVVFAIDGIKEIIDDAKEGFLVSSRDHKSMAGAIRKMYHNDSLRLTLGRQARRRAEESFSLDIFANNCEKAFESLTNRQKQGF